jgi:hypothetical protein
MTLRQRVTLRHGLRARTDAPAMQTSELRDPLVWVAAIAACIAFLLLIAAIQMHEQITEGIECAAATR